MGTLQVIDMAGRQLSAYEVNSSLRIPHSSLASGVYVLRLITDNQIKTQKIILNK